MTSIVSVLAAERMRRLEQVTALQGAYEGMLSASENSNADDEHDPEGATIAFERSQLSVQLTHAQNAVKEVEHALARAQEGSYGSCEKCDEQIAPERLVARPTAVTCITCAKRAP